MSITARLVAIALLCAALVAGWWRLTAHFETKGYQRRAAEDTAAMQAQEQRNRELQRAAELHYTVQAGVRDRFIVQTIREIRYAAAPLASCPVPDAARRLLNDAALCARGDSPASCGVDDALRKP